MDGCFRTCLRLYQQGQLLRRRLFLIINRETFVVVTNIDKSALIYAQLSVIAHVYMLVMCSHNFYARDLLCGHCNHYMYVLYV